jgi:hypothetical protein
MTLNERLFVAGLLEAWDEAALHRDRDRMIEILSEVTDIGVARDGVMKTVDGVLADPGKYGF